MARRQRILFILLCLSLLSGVTIPMGAKAATSLGDAQGVPPGFTPNFTYPDYTDCWVLRDGKYPYTLSPMCNTSLPRAESNFYSAVFSVNPSNLPTVGQTKYLIAGPNGDSFRALVFQELSSGSTPTVGLGESITLQWSCLPRRTVFFASCRYNVGDPHCNDYTGTQYTVNPLSSSVAGSGSGTSFNFTNESIVGTRTVVAPSVAGTYNFTLTCSGPYNMPAMTIPVTVSSAPPTGCSVTLESRSTNTYILRSGATGRVIGPGYNFCVTNAGVYDYFVPANTSNEIGAFVNRIPYLDRITVVSG